MTCSCAWSRKKSHFHFCLYGFFFTSPSECRLFTIFIQPPRQAYEIKNNGNLDWKKRIEVCCLQEFAGDEIGEVCNLTSSVSLYSSSPLFRNKDYLGKSTSKQQRQSLSFLHGERNKGWLSEAIAQVQGEAFTTAWFSPCGWRRREFWKWQSFWASLRLIPPGVSSFSPRSSFYSLWGAITIVNYGRVEVVLKLPLMSV